MFWQIPIDKGKQILSAIVTAFIVLDIGYAAEYFL